MCAGANSVRSDISIENPPTILRSPEGAASPCAASATISTVEETSATATGLMALQQAGFLQICHSYGVVFRGPVCVFLKTHQYSQVGYTFEECCHELASALHPRIFCGGAHLLASASRRVILGDCSKARLPP